jgi:hypothetical protein
MYSLSPFSAIFKSNIAGNCGKNMKIEKLSGFMAF